MKVQCISINTNSVSVGLSRANDMYYVICVHSFDSLAILINILTLKHGLSCNDLLMYSTSIYFCTLHLMTATYFAFLMQTFRLPYHLL